MELETLRDLYIDELKDLYSAEKQLLKALPKMAKAASSPKLSKAFTTHLKQTERQIQRLERVFQQLDASPRGKKCIGMEGLIEEAQELIKEKPEPDVLDAGLIAKAQHVEHYEIAGYGTVRSYAQQLGEDRQAELLQQTLDEEGATDKLLTELSQSINLEAAQADEEEATETTSRSKRGAGARRGVSKQATGGPSADREVSRGASSEAGRTGARSVPGRNREEPEMEFGG